MIALLRSFSLPHLRRHRLRVALTAAGIALGVAAVVAIRLVNDSVTTGMRSIAEEMTGGAHLIVSGDRTGVPEALLDTVKSVAGVAHVTPLVKQTVELRAIDGQPTHGRLAIVAVDSLDDAAVPQSVFRREDLELPDPLRFVAQPHSIVVTEAFATRHDLVGRLGRAQLEVSTPAGPVTLTVRGVLHANVGAALGGNLGIMDTYAAQKVLGRGAKVDELDVALAGVPSLDEVADARERIAAVVGAGFDVERPQNRGRQSERIVHAWQAAVGLLSLVTLFVGAFLIYNTVAVAVAERRREIGILRSLGVSRAAVAAAIVLETLLVAAVGSAFGLGLGLAGARHLLRLTTGMMSALVLDTGVQSLSIAPIELAIGLAAGLLLALGAAAGPALAAARLPPVDALRANPPEARRLRLAGWLGVAGAVLLGFSALGCAAPISRHSALLASGTLLALLFGFVLLCPALVPIVSNLVARGLGHLGPVGRVTAAALRRAPARAAVTVCAIAVGCALVVSSSTVAQSFRVSIGAYVARTTVADILVSCSAEVFSPATAPMAPEVAAALSAHPAVAEVQRVRVVDVNLGGRRADLFALDAAAWERRVGFPFIRGEPKRAAQALIAGEGLAVSANFAHTFGLDVGDAVSLPTPKGTLSLPIVGVFLDYSTAFGAVVIDRRAYQRHWDDDLTDLFHVYLRPDADVARVRAELQATVGDPYDVFILTTTEVRDKVRTLLDDCFLLIRLQDLVAAAVAVLGLINLLVIAVMERRRELAVLRAIGSSRAQVAAAVILEGVALAWVGLILGVALGLGLGWINVAVVTTLHTGWRFEFHVNAWLLLELAVVVIVAAAAAAGLPARHAARGVIARGLVEE
jgi:putative ABC transport system permease protein